MVSAAFSSVRIGADLQCRGWSTKESSRVVPKCGHRHARCHLIFNLNKVSGHSLSSRQGTSIAASKNVAFYVRDPVPWPTDITLPLFDATQSFAVDLVVVGAGPAGVSVAERVAEAGYSVVVVDPDPHAPWPNNYGVWLDEFEALGLDDCLDVIWPKAKVFLNNTPEGAKYLDRPYGRVDRPGLKRKLLTRCVQNGVKFLKAAVNGVTHADGSSTISCADGKSITSCLVLDATGHKRKLVQYDKPFNPGYQGAYGIIAEVESHPFDVDTMLFMDWRNDHTLNQPGMKQQNEQLPTFLYAMPFSSTKVFLEETSLVARPAVGFQDLKDRLEARMNWLGIKVKHIEEEEYCLIPMGGVLPKHPQRVLAIGGTAGMVHPSTGYMVARMLGAVPGISDAIIDQLAAHTDKASDASQPRPASEEYTEAMTAAIWRRTWPVERIRQREFFCFGMDVLLKLDLYETREFFTAFFSLSDFHWHGFLSSRLTFIQLIGFGLSLFANSSNAARSNLLLKGVPGLALMLLALAKTFGKYYEVMAVSDVEVVDSKRLAAAPSVRAQ